MCKVLSFRNLTRSYKWDLVKFINYERPFCSLPLPNFSSSNPSLIFHIRSFSIDFSEASPLRSISDLRGLVWSPFQLFFGDGLLKVVGFQWSHFRKCGSISLTIPSLVSLYLYTFPSGINRFFESKVAMVRKREPTIKFSFQRCSCLFRSGSQ